MRSETGGRGPLAALTWWNYQEKHSPQRHGAYTENHGGLFPTDSFSEVTSPSASARSRFNGFRIGNRLNGNYIVDSLKWQVFFQGAESAGCKKPGPTAQVSVRILLGALKVRPRHVQNSRLNQRNIRAKAVILRAFSAPLTLLRPPGPLGRAITSGAFGAACT